MLAHSYTNIIILNHRAYNSAQKKEEKQNKQDEHNEEMLLCTVLPMALIY